MPSVELDDLKANSVLQERHTAFFDIGFIKNARGRKKATTDAALIRQILAPKNDKPAAPNIIFDAGYYSAQCSKRGYQNIGNPVRHFLELGDLLAIPPHPFFDPEHYRRSRGLKRNINVNSVSHALSVGMDRLRDFHPLINPGFIARQLGRKDHAKLTEDLFAGRISQRFDPHPLFSLGFYEKQTGEKFDSTAEAISHYLTSETDNATHYLFDIEYYSNQASTGNSNFKSLLHFLTTGRSHNPHPLFNTEYYRRNAYKKTGQVISRPFEHFIQFGLANSIDASPYFDLGHYQQVVSVPVDPYHHYLQNDGYRFHSPHPLIDVDDYALLNGDGSVERFSEAPAIDFALQPPDSKPVSIAFFDPGFYRAKYPDLKQVRTSMIEHYFKFGLREKRYPNAMFSEQYVLSTIRKATLLDENVVEHYFNTRMHERKRVVYVLPDASDTAENRNAIFLLSHLGRLEDVELVTLVGSAGPLMGELRRVSHVQLLHENYNHKKMDVEAAENEIARIFKLLGANRPIIAFCDGVEDSDLSKLISSRNIPVVSILRKYTEEDSARVGEIAASSTEVVFPATFMRDNALRSGFVRADNLTVGSCFVPETVLQSVEDRTEARRSLRKRLNLPDDAFIVFGSGGLDLDSGVDDFGTAARLLCETTPAESNIHFIWKGEGPKWPNTPYFYVNQEMRFAGYADRVHFVSKEISYEDIYLGADVYFLPVRLVPLPSTILFAKAYGLPVVTNDSRSAAAEFTGNKAGIVYPERDLRAAADAIKNLYDDSKLYKTMAKGARQSYKADWSSDAAVDRMHRWVRSHAQQVVRGLNRKQTTKDSLTIFSHGRLEDQDFAAQALRQFNLKPAKQLFVGGRFEPDIAALVSEMAPGQYDVFQPAGPEAADRIDALKHAIEESGAKRSVFVDLDDLLTPEILANFDGQKIVTVSKLRTDLQNLYKHGLSYDEIWVSHPAIIDKMRTMNPLIADRMKLVHKK